MSASSLRVVWEAGAGAVVTKSLGLKSRRGHPNPTLVNIGCGYINSMGLPNPGAQEYAEELRTAKQGGDIVVIASAYGALPQELAEIARIVEEAGADAVELNLSCPNVEGVGMEVGQDPNLVRSIVRSVKRAVRIPVLAKLTPNISDIKVVAKAAEEAGADGLVAINTLRAIAIDLETGRPILASKMGGLSGPAIKPVALRCVYEVYGAVKIPVIGCGGVATGRDVYDHVLAGADLVQVGSTYAQEGPACFSRIHRELVEVMQKKGYATLASIPRHRYTF